MKAILELVLSIFGLITSIVIYFKQNRNYQNTMEDDVCNEVIKQYKALFFSSKDTGVSALIKSGIQKIQSNQRIISILQTLEISTGKNPLGKYFNAIQNYGLIKFFNGYGLKDLQEKNPEEWINSH